MKMGLSQSNGFQSYDESFLSCRVIHENVRILKMPTLYLIPIKKRFLKYSSDGNVFLEIKLRSRAPLQHLSWSIF